MIEDITVNEFCDYAGRLDLSPPNCKKYDIWGTQHYKTQKAHVIAWFASNGDDYSTKAVYNRLQNPGMLVWIAAAFGADESEIKQAAEAAEIADKIDSRKACKVFRDVLPFARICQLIDDPKKWVYDKEFLKIAEEPEEDGWRNVLPDKEKDYEALVIGLFN